MAPSSLSIKKHFRKLKDHRRRHRRLHLFLDILVIAICGVVSGCTSWTQIAAFGRKRHDWLKRFLSSPNGIPCHDTFERIFERVAPIAFQNCFRDWMLALAGTVGLEQIAIDGKTARRSGTTDLGPLHLVSAWATKNHLSLGQVAVDEEIQRNHGDSQAPRTARPQGCPGEHRRHRLPEGDRRCIDGAME